MYSSPLLNVQKISSEWAFKKDGFARVGFTRLGFTKAGFTRFGFSKVCLTRARFTRVGFSKKVFTKVGLTRVNLSKVIFSKVSFTTVGFTKVNLFSTQKLLSQKAFVLSNLFNQFGDGHNLFESKGFMNSSFVRKISRRGTKALVMRLPFVRTFCVTD